MADQDRAQLKHIREHTYTQLLQMDDVCVCVISAIDRTQAANPATLHDKDDAHRTLCVFIRERIYTRGVYAEPFGH